MQGSYPDPPAAAAIAEIRRGLLRWFQANARLLPWRANRDPYRIWVSEVMLQQTQVAAVIPYYERFLTQFPTLAALAAADESDVLRAWEGLGYYRRARHLHAAARLLFAEHGGVVPNDPALFGALPGVGRYTLGAVLSQAFDRRLPIVDGNVQRVLSRLFLCDADPASKAARDWVWNAAEALLPARGAGDFNQALMELGQLVCVPQRPQCLLCPVAKRCAARAAGRATELPRPKAAAPLTAVRAVAVVIEKEGKLLLCRRPADASRWAGLWEFPHGEPSEDEVGEMAAARFAQVLTGLRVTPTETLPTIRHGVTRFRITMEAWRATAKGGRFRSAFYVEHAWAMPAELEGFALSRPQRRLALAAAARR